MRTTAKGIPLGQTKTPKGHAQAQGILQMAIGQRTYRTAHHATGRMAPKSGLRHRRRGARNHGDQQAHNRLREKERGLRIPLTPLQQKPCNFLKVVELYYLHKSVALRSLNRW
jgi:hypothetical protein